MTGCCREWFENLSAYRDGEANAADVARIEAHVEACLRCRDALDRLPAVGEALARAHAIEVPPRVAERAREVVTSARRRQRLPRAGVVAVAVALAAVAAAVVFSLRRRGLEPAITDDLVAHHLRGFAREKPCDFETSDPKAASAWLSSQLGYSVRVPTPEGTRLLGVRLCKLEGVRTAALMYTHVETPLTIFVPPPGSEPAAHVAAFAGREVRCVDAALHTRICAVGADQTMVAVEDGARARVLASTLASRRRTRETLLEGVRVVPTRIAVDAAGPAAARAPPKNPRRPISAPTGMEHATLKKELTIGYEAALAKLPEALKSEGFGVLTEIDIAQTLKNKIGVDFRRYKILGACNPTLAFQALSSVLEIGVMLPCNVVVYEADDGHAVVHAIDPTMTIASEPRLAELAKTVRDKLAAALSRLE